MEGGRYEQKADVYFGRDQEVLERRRKIKQQTLLKRRMDFILNK
jgi:hypothetical protein